MVKEPLVSRFHLIESLFSERSSGMSDGSNDHRWESGVQPWKDPLFMHNDVRNPKMSYGVRNTEVRKKVKRRIPAPTQWWYQREVSLPR